MEPDARPLTSSRRNQIIIGSLIVLVAVLLGVIALLSWPEAPKQKATNTHQAPRHTPVIRSSLVATGLQAPVSITSTPNKADTRLFVIEQAGIIRILDSKGGIGPVPFLDIRDRVMYEGEMGLLGLAFSPHYEQDGYFYVDYVDKSHNTVIARYKVSTKGNVADPMSEKVIFTVKQPYPNHKGGGLAFGPDGYLYAALGDGGGVGDPDSRAQDKNDYLGKILRIDVGNGNPYMVPATNPFVKETGTKPEIWAYGLRNPWRISFDGKTGDLYIADVGQGLYEELDVQRAGSKGGENYGWRCREGLHDFNTTSNCSDQDDYIQPVLEYGHEDGSCSITGGYVYRGSRFAELAGKYFYGDYCSGQLSYVDSAQGNYKPVLAAKSPYMISTFGQGSDGEIYFADYKTGSIYHIEDAADVAGSP